MITKQIEGRGSMNNSLFVPKEINVGFQLHSDEKQVERQLDKIESLLK